MKKNNSETRKKLARLPKIVKGLLTTVSQLSLILTGVSVHAIAPVYAASPLLAQTPVAQASVNNVVDAIKTAAGGSVNATNAAAALTEAMASNPGVSLDVVVAAINQLNLEGAALANAISAAGMSFGVEKSEVVAALITNTYMDGGKDAAKGQITDLRTSLGNNAVDEALKSTDEKLGSLENDKLAQIEPAAGGDDNGNQQETSVYNG